MLVILNFKHPDRNSYTNPASRINEIMIITGNINRVIQRILLVRPRRQLNDTPGLLTKKRERGEEEKDNYVFHIECYALFFLKITISFGSNALSG